MPKRRRPILPGVPHHVIQRAAHGEFILETADAKAVLMSFLKKWCAKLGIEVHGFVLMNNHFHLSATPEEEAALGEMMGRVTSGFSRWLNAGRGEVGPNWQGAFFAAPMDETHARQALRYIERNPVAAGLVDRPWDYRWSSAAFHAGRGPAPELLGANGALAPTEARAWREFLLIEPDDSFRRRLRDCTARGIPLAAEEWIDRAERAFGLALRPRRVGRPRVAASMAPVLDLSARK